MYPAQFFSLFPAFPRTDKVFVAMSFDQAFETRWDKVIDPAIRRVRADGKPLQPLRVDVRKVSDSILTDILDGLSSSRFVLADLTSISEIDGKAVRNGN